MTIRELAEVLASDDVGNYAPSVEHEEYDTSRNGTRENVNVEQAEDCENNSNGGDATLGIDDRKVKHWKDSEFAVGCVNVTWEDDRPAWWFNSGSSSACGGDGGDNSTHIVDNHVLVSSIVCGCLGAGRVGNMAILAESTETVEEAIMDHESGQVTIRQKKRPKLLWVVGPYWTVNIFITFPLIIGVSSWICYQKVVDSNVAVIITWSIGTFFMVFSLCMISCRNPGILYRHSQIPGTTEEEWRWNDQARTYRPASSRFDTECQVVVEGFDHTCPWTGTAIGSRNMFWFKVFVFMVPVMLVYTIVMAAFSSIIPSFF
mmetsp:Transcript_15306/g.31399  ORF Transcript_15306/g.31399 Transcript_15306/m.31399 type:complete len:317 (+) Transcript_15306:149-1099(+)|eukprot:CAMPEP_0201133650 /NCGR_PEP_ID=MMETSP0850-20130426/49460_1 /ASSEMBLY_ACC=CAM_ASM_000622 /TAXON_ID=183588 /ORGANISM="Pseudo-nitzschia fraudulenta, Strain WWA7" /LENGTH=316 /DNA_ID=CAMNT_0047404359 /DNA_START=149 /DNA_END=1099 /DNA_ORIENTATION=+